MVYGLWFTANGSLLTVNRLLSTKSKDRNLRCGLLI